MFETTIRLHGRPQNVQRLPLDSQGRTTCSHSPRLADEQMRADRLALDAWLARIHNAVSDLTQKRGQFFAEWQTAAVELAFAIASRLVHQQLDSGQFPTEAIVRDMLGSFANGPEITVWLNPLDSRMLHERLDGRPLFAGREDSIRVAEDASLERGDCRIEDGEKIMLSQLSEQFRKIRDDMIRRLGDVA